MCQEVSTIELSVLKTLDPRMSVELHYFLSDLGQDRAWVILPSLAQSSSEVQNQSQNHGTYIWKAEL